jgi:hypothetical protein
MVSIYICWRKRLWCKKEKLPTSQLGLPNNLASGAPKSQWASNHLKRLLTLARASMQDSPIPQQMEMGIQLWDLQGP